MSSFPTSSSSFSAHAPFQHSPEPDLHHRRQCHGLPSLPPPAVAPISATSPTPNQLRAPSQLRQHSHPDELLPPRAPQHLQPTPAPSSTKPRPTPLTPLHLRPRPSTPCSLFFSDPLHGQSRSDLPLLLSELPDLPFLHRNAPRRALLLCAEHHANISFPSRASSTAGASPTSTPATPSSPRQPTSSATFLDPAQHSELHFRPAQLPLLCP